MANNIKTTSIKNIGEYAPIPMMATDETGKIVWTNAALNEICNLTADDLVGYTKEDLPSVAHRALFKQGELIHIKGVDVPECWLEVKLAQSTDANDQKVSLHYYHDVSQFIVYRQENAALEETIKFLEIKDSVTGLANQRGISLIMDLHLSRSRRYQNPFCLIKILVSITENADDSQQLLNSVMLSISRFLRERLRWVDQISRWDDNNFVILLPETEGHDAEAIRAEINDSKQNLELLDDVTADNFSFKTASVCWQKGDDQRTLIEKADTLLNN